MSFSKSLSVPVVIRCLILLAGMSVFVSNAAIFRKGCLNLGFSLSTLNTLFEDQKIELDGMWNNTSFGSNGSANFALQLQNDQLSLDFNLNGGVFGQGDPPNVSLPGTVGTGGIIFEASNDPFYGDIRFVIGYDTSITASFSEVPSAGIDRVEATGGLLPPDGDGGAATITVNYTVFFPGGGQALGVIEAAQTSGPTPVTLFFAQVGNGDGLTSDMVFSNPTDQTVTGVISFGDDAGAPLSFGISDGSAASASGPGANPTGQAEGTVPFSVAPLATVTISTDGLGGLKVGSAAVLSTGFLGGVIRFSLPGVGIAGVPSSLPLQASIMPVRRVAGGINTGVALRNASGKAVNITVSLREGDVEVASKVLQDFPANGHLAQFINEMFPGVNTDSFAGSLVVRVDGGFVGGTGLELGPDPGQFTTLPVTPIP